MEKRPILDLFSNLWPEADRCREVWDVLPTIKGPLAVACSGGSDSVALLHILWAQPSLQARLVVFHFDHGVRAGDSAKDAQFVRSLADNLDLPFVLGRRQTDCKRASEADLRQARLEFFHGEMERRHMTHLATAHHLDDAIETLLLRLARGAGLEGLIAPRAVQRFGNGFVHLRPLITFRKKNLQTFLSKLNIPWNEDITNESMAYFRNRVRHQLLPLWERLEDRRNLVQALGRSRTLLTEDAIFLENYSRGIGRKLRSTSGLNSVEMRRIERPIRRRILLHFFLEHGCQNGRVFVDLVLRKLDRNEPFKISIGPNIFLQDDGATLSIIELQRNVETI